MKILCRIVEFVIATFNVKSSRRSARCLYQFWFSFLCSFFRFFLFISFFVICTQLKTEDEENELELHDTNGKSDAKTEDMATESSTTTMTENGSEILMTVVTKADDSSPAPANHQQVFWIQSGSHPPPPSLYTIKQLNYSQVA